MGDRVSRLDAPLSHGEAWDTAAAFSCVCGRHGVPPVLRFGGPNGVQPCAGHRSGRRLRSYHRGGAAHVHHLRRERGCAGLAACSGCRCLGIAFRLAFATYGLWKEQCARADAVEQRLSELDSTKAERRARLREFYSSVEAILGRNVARDTSPEEFREYLTEMEGWVASAATWIAENMGEAALSRFLDRSAGLAGFYRGAINEEHNRAVSLLNLYRTNLRSLIESDVWT